MSQSKPEALGEGLFIVRDRQELIDVLKPMVTEFEALGVGLDDFALDNAPKVYPAVICPSLDVSTSGTTVRGAPYRSPYRINCMAVSLDGLRKTLSGVAAAVPLHRRKLTDFRPKGSLLIPRSSGKSIGLFDKLSTILSGGVKP